MPLVRFSVSADPELHDALADCLLSAGAGALEEGPRGLSVYADSTELLRTLEAALADFRLRAKEAFPDLEVLPAELSEVDPNWNKWLEHLVPEQVTATFVARPTSVPDRPADERTIWLEPSAAFGEGGHASTRLAARAVERHARSRPGARLLDVGTGTGVLAFVGLFSGARTALAIDIDEAAVDAARKNAELNAVADRCRVESTPLEEVSEHFDLVLANMIAKTLLELAPALAMRLAPGGLLVLSGLLIEDATTVLAAFAELGLCEIDRSTHGDWCALELSAQP